MRLHLNDVVDVNIRCYKLEITAQKIIERCCVGDFVDIVWEKLCLSWDDTALTRNTADHFHWSYEID